VFNRFLIDIGMHYYLISEIGDAKAHIEALKEITGERPVLIMFDRNYALLEFVDFLEKSGVKYLIRLYLKGIMKRNGFRWVALTGKWSRFIPERGWDT
jgi:hypothetical protein